MSDNQIKDVVDDLVSLRHIELEERRKDRKFKFIKFLLLGTGFMAVFLYQTWMFGDLFNSDKDKIEGDYVSIVRINGSIGPGLPASAEVLNPAFRRAFEDEDSKGIIVVINSPGGTPVQAGLMRDRLIALRKKHPEKKLAVIGEDMMTSGGLLIASGSENIYAHPASMVGSIGVIMASFGFDRIIDRFDIERRVFIAGDSKASMDPFQELNNKDVAATEKRLTEIHDYFISAIKESRGDKLDLTNKELFTGSYWTGDRSVELGIIDGVKDLATVVEEFGADKVEDYTPRLSFFSKLTKWSNKVSVREIMDELSEVRVELK